MKLSNVLRLYWVRLRARYLQECFAIVGIAAGVALLFASQVSSSSLQSSVASLSGGIAGRSTLQLQARDPAGFPESMLARVRAIPGVRLAAPLMEADTNALGPKGSASAQLIGADGALRSLGGVLVPHTALTPFGGIGAVVLSKSLSHTVGVSHFGQEVHLQIGGRTVEAPLYVEPHEHQSAPLRASPVVLAPLRFAQELTARPGALSRILVQPAPGAQTRVRAALTRLAAGRLNVEDVDYEQQLFTTAATANSQSTQLFAAISALVGFLFAFSAMLFTIPARRRLVVDLRRVGYTSKTAIEVLVLDAFTLGAVACILGLALGDELSLHLLRTNPTFLSLAFTLGSERAVSWQSVAIATGAGMLAAIAAIVIPLRDTLVQRPLAAPGERAGGGDGAGRLALAGLACLAAASALLLVAPDAAIPGMALLLGALLSVLPYALVMALSLVQRISGALVTSVVPHAATMELRAVRARGVAIAATGAVAIFGGVAIQGAHRDLLAGLAGAAHDLNASAGVWVSPTGSYNLMDTTPFRPGAQGRLARLPGVSSVSLYRGGLLDDRRRRVLVIAPPRDADPLLAPNELVQGNPVQAAARLRAGGWVAISRAVATEHRLHIGERFTLPSPSPTPFRVAALITNLGWTPGTIVMNADDYARAWGSPDVSAYGVTLASGASATRVAREIDAALGVDSGLAAQSASGHAAQQRALSQRALARLTQIATLILAASVLAMAAALGAMIWQRRPYLAKLKLDGLRRAQLWRTIVLETVLLLGVGSSLGALFGLYGQRLADRALAETINFPVAHSLSAVPALSSVGLVLAAAVAILAIPGYLASSVPAALALSE